MSVKRQTLPTLDIIIPAYNEANRISGTLDAYLSYIAKQKDVVAQLYIVINGSSDATAKVIQEYAKKFPKLLRYTEVTEKIGKGGAVIHGFRTSQADLVAFVDADNSVTPKWFDTLLQPLLIDMSIDATISSRALPDSVLKNRNRGRIAISQVFNGITNLFFSLDIKDTQCGAKIFRKNILEKILPTLTLANMAFDVDVLYAIKKAGGKTLEVPIHWYDVDGLTTKSPLKIGAAMGLGITELRLVHSPLKFMTIVLKPFYRLFLTEEQYNARLLQKQYTES